jgi:hypothetical protein
MQGFGWAEQNLIIEISRAYLQRAAAATNGTGLAKTHCEIWPRKYVAGTELVKEDLISVIQINRLAQIRAGVLEEHVYSAVFACHFSFSSRDSSCSRFSK